MFLVSRYFINISKSPLRELCYIVQSVGIYSTVSLICSIDLLFFGMCLFIAVMYKKLLKMLESIDRNSNEFLVNNKKKIHKNNRSLRHCFEFHLAVLR